MAAAALSREDLQRAGAILKSIVADLETPQELSEVLTEEERETLGDLQGMLDIVQSPLFAAVVDITDKCKKSIVESERWNKAADVKATAADVVAEFKERYRVPSVSGESLHTDNLLDDTTITSSPTDDPDPLTGAHHHTSASLLNREPQRTPSLGSYDSVSSTGSRRNRGKKTEKGLTLTLLTRDHAQSPAGDIPLSTLAGRSPPAQQIKRDTSFSSLSSDASPPPLPPSLPPTDDLFPTDLPPTPPTAEGERVDVREGLLPKDLLFFMRDEKSMTDVRTSLNGKWGRSPRKIQLPRHLSHGLELCGLSTTGVFVSDVTLPELEERAQVGDQILQVNSQPVDDMAWFEVEQLMHKSPGVLGRSHRGSSEGLREESEGKETEGESCVETCSLLVQYNPAGLGEVKRTGTNTRTWT